MSSSPNSSFYILPAASSSDYWLPRTSVFGGWKKLFYDPVISRPQLFGQDFVVNFEFCDLYASIYGISLRMCGILLYYIRPQDRDFFANAVFSMSV